MPQPSYPSLCHRQDARSAIQFSKLVVHPSPPRSMLEHTVQTRPDRLHPPLGWPRTLVRRGPAGESMCDIPDISCELDVFWTSAVGEKPIVCTIPLHNASPDFAADVVVRSNDRPEIAELLYYLETVAVN